VRVNAKVNIREKGSLDFVGDHVAINFINTWRMHEGVLTDTLQSDEDVIAWMRKMNIRLPLLRKPRNPAVLCPQILPWCLASWWLTIRRRPRLRSICFAPRSTNRKS